MSILIVDDSSFMRLTMKKILSKHGYKYIKEAGNGLEALKLVKEDAFDLILLDISMDIMDGISFLEQMKALGILQPVIVVSAEGEERIIRAAIELGALDFIIKPFKEQRAINIISRYYKAE